MAHIQFWVPTLLVAVSALRQGLPVRSRIRKQSNYVKMEDFGLFKGTKELAYGEVWSREPVISERKLEKYLNQEGYRYKMNPTKEERQGKKLFDFPEMEFSLPLNINIKISPPQVSSFLQAIGFDSAKDISPPPSSMETKYDQIPPSDQVIQDKKTAFEDKTPLILR